MIFLMGGRGYVGSAYARLLDRMGLDYEILTRENFDTYVGRSCDLFINANGNSVKFLADREPLAEFDASVRSVVRSLTEIQSKAYIFLSSGDVYPDTTSPDTSCETQSIDLTQNSRYGFHKFLAETYVRSRHPNAWVFRMGGFVGQGMVKNAIFDMLNDKPVWLDLESELSFINTDTAADYVYRVFASKTPPGTFNLGPRGTVLLRDVYRRLGSKSEVQPDARRVRFELKTQKLEAALGAPLCTAQDEVEAFFQSLGR